MSVLKRATGSNVMFSVCRPFVFSQKSIHLSSRKIKNTAQIRMGTIYCLKYIDIFSFLLESLKEAAPAFKSIALFVSSLMFLSLFSSRSNDSVIVLETSISSWFSLSMFYYALASRNSLRFRFIYFSESNRLGGKVLTELDKGILIVYCVDFTLVVHGAAWAKCVL